MYPLKLMDQSREMWAVMNRLIELTGWIVLVVSVILLGVASHIDNYQPLNRVLRYNTSKLCTCGATCCPSGCMFSLVGY
ncbi:division septum protein Blr [Escherichia coli]